MPSDASRGRTILVVDDEPYIRQLLKSALPSVGFTVLAADGGKQAIEIYQREHASIDLVLLDVRMPEMDGPKTAAALRAINPAVRYCFMSGDSGRYTMDQLFGVGAVQMFLKPFGSMTELADELWNLADGDGLSS